MSLSLGDEHEKATFVMSVLRVAFSSEISIMAYITKASVTNGAVKHCFPFTSVHQKQNDCAYWNDFWKSDNPVTNSRGREALSIETHLINLINLTGIQRLSRRRIRSARTNGSSKDTNQCK